MAGYEDTALQREAIRADKERTSTRVFGLVATFALVIGGSLMGYGCTMSHDWDVKNRAADTAENQACIKAGSNYMPVQTISKGTNGVHVDSSMSCVTQAAFPIVQAANSNIVKAFAAS